MKIAMFTDNFYPCVGGTETVVQELSTALKNAEEDVFVGTISGKRPKTDEELFNFPVKRARSLKVSGNDFWALPGLDGKFKKQMNNAEIDIIHCHSTASMAAYGLKLAKKKNIPCIITVHTKMKDAVSRHVKSKFIVDIVMKNIMKKLKKADKVYTVSLNMAQELKKYGFKGEVEVVRNGASLKQTFDKNELRQDLKTQYGLPDGLPVFLFVGRIVEYKNPAFIMRVLKLLHDKGLDFKMFFVGEGPDRHKYEKLAEETEMRDKIVFTGGVNDWRELSKYYAAADLFIFPSIFDNDSIAMLEANAYGTPCIVLETTGSAERITDEVNGFICQNDAQKFSDKILSILSEPEKLKKIGENAKTSNCKTWTDVSKIYLEHYRRAIDEKKNGK